MGIEYTPKLTIGWRVKQDYIPDFEERWNDEWSDLGDVAQEASKLLDKSIWADSLCEEKDSWCGDTQIVGVPMFDHELPTREFMKRTEAIRDLAERVYRQVMRKEPEDGPWLISWTQIS